MIVLESPAGEIADYAAAVDVSVACVDIIPGVACFGLNCSVKAAVLDRVV